MEYLHQRLQRVSRSLREELARLVTEISETGLARIQRMLSGERLQRRSGRLFSAWHIVRETVLRARIRPDPRVRYALIHETGGVIVPRRAPYLTFQIDGRWVRTTRVVIPARHYVRDSIRELKIALNNKAIVAIRRIID